MDPRADIISSLRQHLENASQELQGLGEGLEGLFQESPPENTEIAMPASDPLAALTAASQSSDRATAVRHLILLCKGLCPASTGTLSLHEDEQTTVVVGAWDGDSVWVQGTHNPDGQSMGELAEALRQRDPNDALILPLQAFGLKLGELRCWLADTTPAPAENQQQWLSAVASMALGGQALLRRLQLRTVRDALTGLFNRRYLEDTLNREIHRGERNNTQIGLILLELDEFEQYKQEYGPTVADRMIQAVGGLLLSSFRGSDVCCRFDGERFAVVLPDASVANTMRRAEGMVVAISHVRITQKGTALSGLTASAGVAGYPKHADGTENLVAAAESALFMARDGDGNKAVAAEKVE